MAKSNYFDAVDPKVNFAELEKKLLEHWYKDGIVKKYLDKNKVSQKYFSFLDGPITANNPMGVHHAWGRTYKDLWQRFKSLQGFRQRHQNGFDCQGLWVEVEVEKELGIRTKKDIENLVPGDTKASIAKFIDLCKERVLKYSGIQTEQSKRLGYFMDWENSYYTMGSENNYMIWHFLKKCFEKGLIYKGHDVVPWCPRCETAISEHEILTEDYKELIHDSIYLELPIKERENEYLLIWTTTPWTIPANTAVAVDEKIDYALVKGTSGDHYWVAKELVKNVFKDDPHEILKVVKGKELVGLEYTSPFDDLPAIAKAIKEAPGRIHIVVATDDQLMPISTEEGTGLVHTSTSTGQEDFKLGKVRNLVVIPAINDVAEYLEDFGELAGKNAKKHPELIFDYLKQKENKGENWIFAIVPYKHRYPACWRCKTELVWKIADEWYIAIDPVREDMKKVTKQISWLPKFGLKRELDWLKNMHDWLISKKNRYWGLALPIWECKKCGNFEVLGGVEELKERAFEGWDEFAGHTPHKPWIDEVKIKCAKCGETSERIPDVGNPWLDAGIVPFSTVNEDNQDKPDYKNNNAQWKKWFPVDFITESFPGQFKNWFYSLIAMSTVLENKEPFKTVLGFGTLFGEDGRPMHKSWGNSIEFNEGADKMGVDVMRWMYARQNPADNMLFGYKLADETRRRFHLKLWNTYNYFVTYANLDGWQSKSSDKSSDNILDKWIRVRLQETINTVTEKLESYDAYFASAAIDEFVDDLSNWYIRRSRDRQDKNYFYQTTSLVLIELAKVLAPFTPFISEVIYTNLTKEESVHLSVWPKSEALTSNETKLVEEMKTVRVIVERAHAIRKENSIPVRQPLAKVIVANINFDLAPYEKLIGGEINVKGMELKEGKGDLQVDLDTSLTPELKAEGEARDLIRKIQEERKRLGTDLDEEIVVTLPDYPTEFEEYIKKNALVKKLLKGEFKVERE